MNQPLLDILRELADLNVCRLPEGWRGKSHPDSAMISYPSKRHSGIWIHADASRKQASTERILEVLGSLYRAVEAEGAWDFERSHAYAFWKVWKRNMDPLAVCLFIPMDRESEAIALARCLRAACAVEVVG
jgi:hypothetical protein